MQFRVECRNKRSNEAVIRIGATKEGILRKGRILYNGYARDTVYNGIIDEEWPEVKNLLIHLLTFKYAR